MKKGIGFAAVGTRRMPTALCPYCGATLDMVTGVAFDTTISPTITEGDYSVCGQCLRVLRFDGRRFYQQVSEEKAAEVYAESKLLRDFRESITKQRADRVRDELTSKTGKRKETVQ